MWICRGECRCPKKPEASDLELVLSYLVWVLELNLTLWKSRAAAEPFLQLLSPRI